MSRKLSMFVVTSMSDFSASAGMLSGPAAFPLLICLMAILISSFVGGFTSMGRSVCAASMSRGFIGAGLFRSSSKYSTHFVPLFLNFSDWSAFFVFDRSLWFTVFPC
ncbi:unnamed protein product [Schistosoma margrebowiei]|uniref:Uncharacterized protein n=1 Tax=Schistosoma margrebowiei TaxID=48269 RepID=A0A3P7WWA6_9TREM|nr:unnamed protein product [Schistosoma margrebowiei]